MDNQKEENIIKFINENLTIDTEKKNKLGEVFTPIDLINKVLDLLPTNVWTNHNLRWLDPCAGSGNFLAIIYIRLMNGLKSWQQNEAKRSSHIIKNMLYFCEIDKANSALIKKMVSNIIGSKVAVNLLVGDFLSDSKQNKEFVKDGFDIIVGNPPFQDDPTIINDNDNINNKRIIGHKNKLYERILDKCLDILLDNGHLGFITPNNLFAGNSSAVYKRIVTDNKLAVSSIVFEKKSFPGVQQLFCYFLINKVVKSNKISKTTINNDFTTTLLDRPINPVMNWTNKVESLVKKYISNTLKNGAKYVRGKSVGDYVGNKYKLIYKPDGAKLGTKSLEMAPGYGVKKVVIFAISPSLQFEADFDGKFGVGPNTFFIPIASINEGKKLVNFLQSNEYKELALACKTTRQFLKIGFIEHLNLNKIYNKGNKTRKNKK
jgi:methylase of polypeptide subunit release factors